MAAFTIRLFCFFSLIISPVLTWDHDSYHVQDHMGWDEKEIILNLAAELVRESMLKMRQIIEIREEHDRLISYNVGMLMGRIREKYRFMEEIYRQICDTYHSNTWYRPPSIGVYRPIHFIITLERLHYLELEIDKLVDVMLDEASRDLMSNRAIVGQKDSKIHVIDKKDSDPRPTTTPFPTKSSRSSLRLRSQKEIRQEQSVKSVIRERFLMRRLGNPINMTTAKKRFLRKWPVEDSWSLDKYNQDYK